MRIVRFEKAERFRVFNRVLQVIFFATACFMALFLGWRSLPTVDITSDGRYSLTPETIAYLRTLGQDIDIIGSLSLGEDGILGGGRLRELQGLTARYASVSKKLHIKWVDGFRAQAEYGFKNPYRMLVRNGDRSVWIAPEELYLAQDDVFLGERSLTSALWRLASPLQRNIWVVVSKERWEAEGSWGFKKLQESLASHNSNIKQIEPAALAGEIPQADAIFVLGGSDSLTADELAGLQRTINDHKGNIFMAIDEPASEALVRFLYYNGVAWSATRVNETEIRQRTPAGETLIRDFEEHAITAILKRNEEAVLSRGHWWVLSGRSAMVDVTAWPILKSSLKSVAEGSDKKGPFVLMLALERKAQDKTPSRLLICGGSDWLSNNYLTYRGNQTLLESSLDWVLGSSNLVSIPPRSRQSRQLAFTSTQLWHIGGWVLGTALVFLGIGVIRLATRPR